MFTSLLPSDVSVDLPFTLTHPKPPVEEGINEPIMTTTTATTNFASAANTNTAAVSALVEEEGEKEEVTNGASTAAGAGPGGDGDASGDFISLVDPAQPSQR